MKTCEVVTIFSQDALGDRESLGITPPGEGTPEVVWEFP